jgi:hypothetical protein
VNLNSTATKAFVGFYELLPVGSPEIVRTEDMAKAIGVGQGSINQMRQLLEYTNSMRFSQYKNPREGIARTTYTLIDPPEVAARKIASLPFHSFNDLKASSTRFNDKDADTTVYVAEPRVVEATTLTALPTAPTLRVDRDPETKTVTLRSLDALAPLRKSEPRAFVEAARQYLARWEIAEKHAKALVEAGLAKDTDIILEALNLKEDNEFEAVAKVLPYIDELERQITHLEKSMAAVRDKAAKVTDLEVQIRKLHDQNTRLISASVSR